MVCMRCDRAVALRRSRASCAILLAMCALVAAGCHAWSPASYYPPQVRLGPPPPQPNPALVTALDRDLVWDQIVDVVDNYFQIKNEDRVRLVGDLLTEGRIDTYPRGASTLLEPWNHDSLGFAERLECTLQSIQRTGMVRVMPAQGGYLVEVQVIKELEDVRSPDTGTVSLANAQALRNDNSLQRVTSPVAGEPPTIGWLDYGRDFVLEQLILAEIQERLGGQGARFKARSSKGRCCKAP